MDDVFLKCQKESMAYEFWEETYLEPIRRHIETRYKKEILKNWSISGIVINGDKVLIKWSKRILPLED